MACAIATAKRARPSAASSIRPPVVQCVKKSATTRTALLCCKHRRQNSMQQQVMRVDATVGDQLHTKMCDIVAVLNQLSFIAKRNITNIPLDCLECSLDAPLALGIHCHCPTIDAAMRPAIQPAARGCQRSNEHIRRQYQSLCISLRMVKRER